MKYYIFRKQNISRGKDWITDMIMIIFDNHRIEWKFADLFKEDQQTLKERYTHSKTSLDKTAELHSIWESSKR